MSVTKMSDASAEPSGMEPLTNEELHDSHDSSSLEPKTEKISETVQDTPMAPEIVEDTRMVEPSAGDIKSHDKKKLDLHGSESEPVQESSDLESKENKVKKLRQRKRKSKKSYKIKSEVAEDFHCSVCFRLAVRPTTLSCGHTSCRLCLAQWYFSSKKKECPLCREKYEGHPKINTQIRNLLMRLTPVEMEKREEELGNDAECLKIVTAYDKALSAEVKGTSNNKGNVFTSFFSGIIVTLCSVVVVYLAWYWQSSDNDLLIRKPVLTWKPKDVERWLREMPWAQNYASLAREQGIDGKYLLSLEKDSVQHLLNVTQEDQLKALMFSIDMLKEQGIKLPVTLWDYKAVYPGRSLFLLYGMRHFPRTAVLYMWVYFYEELFQPFVISTAHKDKTVSDLQDPGNNVPSATMLSEFIFYIIFIPHYPVILFAWQMFQHHTFTPLFVLVSSCLYMTLEIIFWKAVVMERQWRTLVAMLKKHVQHSVSAFMFMVFWPIIPRFVGDVFFYGTLYISPVQLSIELYHRLRRH